MQDASESRQDGHQELSRGRSIQSGERRCYTFGRFQLDVGRRRLFDAGEPVTVAPKVLDTLIVLVEHAGQVAEKDELIQQVWPDTFVEEANLTQNVFTLRKLLGDLPDQPEYIATIPRRGYRFVAPVKLVASDADVSAVEPSLATGILVRVRRRWAVEAAATAAIV